MRGDVERTAVGRVPALRAIVHSLRHPEPAGSALYLVGRPGVGMSTVLAQAASVAQRRGRRAIVISASYAERGVPFAGLHQVVHAGRRLEAAREAIELLTSAVGGGVASADAVAATVSLLRVITTQQPTLIIVDNANHLDPQTAEALARALDERVPGLAVIMGGNAIDHRLWPSVQHGTLPGLSRAAARQLLFRLAPAIDPWLADRVLDDADGRPLALIELPIAWHDKFAPGADLFEKHSPLTARLAQSLLDATIGLSPIDRRILLLVSTASTMTTSELSSEIARMDDHRDPGRLDRLVRAGLLISGSDSIKLADPLLGSALVRSAFPEEMGLAAGRTTGATSPPSSGRFEALAQIVRRALGQVATGLRTEATGSVIVDGATAAADMGRFDLVDVLLGELPERLNPLDVARAEILLRQLNDTLWRRSTSARSVCDTADLCRAAGNPDLALDLIANLVETMTWSEVDESTSRQLVRSLDGLAPHRDDPRWVLAWATAQPALVPQLPAADNCGTTRSWSDDADRRLGLAMRRLGRLHPASERLAAVVPGLLAERRYGSAVPAQAALADVEIYIGRWSDAERSLDLLARSVQRTDQRMWRAYADASAALLLALRGDIATATHRARAAEQLVGDRSAWPVRLRVAVARGTVLAAEKRFDEACTEMELALTKPSVRIYAVDLAVAVGLYAEAASRGRKRPESPGVLRSLQVAVDGNPSEDARAHLRFAELLLTSPSDPETEFRGLLHQALDLPWLRARVQLTFGAWLRRERRVAEGREQMHLARAAFTELGARHGIAEAVDELRAAGRVEGDDPLGQLLSPQEIAVVRLAAAGLSNRDIGARLALSPRTVESHLARAYPKLSITSRRQLPARLHELS